MKNLKIPRYIQWLSLTGVVFLLLMTLLRIVLVYVFRTPYTKTVALWDAYLLGARFDLRMVCIACLVLFIIGTIPPLHPLQKKWGKRVSFWIWTLFLIFFAFFYTVDFANYAYLSQRLNASLLNYLDDAKISMRMVWQTYHVSWLLLGLVITVLLLLGVVKLTYNFTLSKPKSANRQSRIIWGILFFVALGIGIFGRVGQFPLRWSDAFGLGNDYAANIALNPFQSFFSTLNFRHATYEADKVKAHYAWMSHYLGVDNPDSTQLDFSRFQAADSSATHTPYNVVLVICESFSGYKSSMYGNPLNTTPYFRSMCDSGVFFERCFTPTYGTARGVWAAITGIPDVQLFKTASRNPAAVDQHTIINDFKGYEKFYFIGGSTSWANIRGLLTNNIDGLHLYEQDDYKAKKVDVWGISDKNLFLEANKVLQQQQKPFIAVIQTADNHRPYTIPDEDKAAFPLRKVPADSLKRFGFGSLDEFNAFRYTDFSFRQFIETAKQQPYFKNTIFIFIGDHGIPGDAGDMFPRAWTDQSLTLEHVPLLFYAPGILKPARHLSLASQIDVLPTAAALCNIPFTNTTLGCNLLDSARLANGGKASCSFIIDAEKRRVGIIHGNYFYSYGLNKSGPEQISSIVNNDKIALTPDLQKEYRNMTDAFYETSRYLLLNNKKK